MASPMIALRLPEGLLERLDRRRGDVGRSAWVRNLIERELGPAPQSRSQNLNAKDRSESAKAAAAISEPDPLLGEMRKRRRVAGDASRKKKPAVVKRWGREFPLSPDAEALLGLVRERGHVSVKVAGEVLGWFEGRVGKAERVLLSLGLITSVSGFLYEAGDGEG